MAGNVAIALSITFILCVLSSYFPIDAVWAVGASRCISLRGNPLIISTRPTIVTGKSIISLRNSHR